MDAQMEEFPRDPLLLEGWPEGYTSAAVGRGTNTPEGGVKYEYHINFSYISHYSSKDTV